MKKKLKKVWQWLEGCDDIEENFPFCLFLYRKIFLLFCIILLLD